MRWEEDLFAYLEDLEAQATAAYDAERRPELEDRSRTEYQQVTLVTRLMASIDLDVNLEVIGHGLISGRLERVGADWCLLAAAGQDWVVSTSALAVVRGASARSQPEPAWPVSSRLGFGGVLRRLAETAEPCSLHLMDGRRHEGVLQRVGADFVEVASGEAGRLLLVAFSALAAVRSRR